PFVSHLWPHAPPPRALPARSARRFLSPAASTPPVPSRVPSHPKVGSFEPSPWPARRACLPFERVHRVSSTPPAGRRCPRDASRPPRFVRRDASVLPPGPVRPCLDWAPPPSPSFPGAPCLRPPSLYRLCRALAPFAA